ncbi:MAG: hypothetical protein QM731_09055 [Chitinophagaceae bacterium]
MKYLVTLLLIATIVTACHKSSNDSEQATQLVFGQYHGFCENHCAVFYKLDSGHLYADNLNNYHYGDPPTFSDIPLNNEKFNLAKSLFDNFPAYLKNQPDSSFGCPDCHDQGVIYIQYSENGIVKKWHIDPVISRLPDEIKTYVQQLSTVMTQLK